MSGAQVVETDEGCDNEVGTRGWVGPKGWEQAEAEAKGGWKTRRLGFEGAVGSWGGGRAGRRNLDRQNDSQWRRGKSKFDSSILIEGGPNVNLTECLLLVGTLCISNPFPTECLFPLHQGCLVTNHLQQNASFCCTQAAYGLPRFNRFPFIPLLSNCCHIMQQILL